MKKEKVVLAFSGGLDTSFCVKYLSEEKGYEVHTAIANTGGFSPAELKVIEQKALALGAASHVTLDIEQEYYEKSIKYMVFGNILRNGTYPISVSSERIFQAIAIIEYAKKIGADYVIHTEMDMATRVAMRFSAQNLFDYFELTPRYAVFEMEVPNDWEGKTVAQMDVRRRYNVNILGLRTGDEIVPLLDPEYVFTPDTHLIIAGDKEAGLRLMGQG